MGNQKGESFVRALEQAERARDPGPLAAVFTDDAELWSVAKAEVKRGREGARAFWGDYLDAFEEIRSRFTGAVGDEVRVALEWESDAVMPGGRRLRYAGVTVLELATDGRVRRFRTYFDPSPFTPAGSAATPEAGGRPVRHA